MIKVLFFAEVRELVG
nr:molybdopterin converting factor 10 kda subunit {N-terminal} [Escherichia coli, Peptide Partial, 15 aa] [Escherichia coli]